MNLYPAIDVMGGNAVRLIKGDFEAKKVYDKDPLSAARGWVTAGARQLHMVDLDGAKSGQPVNLEHLRRITSALDVPVQYGGGLRSLEAVSEAMSAGASRVILGTAAFTDGEFLAGALSTWPGRVLVSVDVRGGMLTTAGWQDTTEMPGESVIARLHERGARDIVFTDVDRDGMLDGPDLDRVRSVADAVRGPWLYSGGIGKLVDLEMLAAMRPANLAGVIVGKALYENRFTVAEAQMALGETP